MRCLCSLLLLFCLALAGCTAGSGAGKAGSAAPASAAGEIAYLDKVQPILSRRCVACHSGPAAPCQLDFGSWAGLARGGSRQTVVDPGRQEEMEPARLQVDGHSPADWRAKGFASVLDSDAAAAPEQPALLRLLSRRPVSPAPSGTFPAQASACAFGSSEGMTAFLAAHPDHHMPFGLPSLAGEEYQTVVDWLAAGARGPDAAETAGLSAIPSRDLSSVGAWEDFLNRQDPKHAMTARYIYEHVFPARITFATGTEALYELIRSRSEPGRPVAALPALPSEDPGGPFYYRFRRVAEAAAASGQVVIDFGGERLKRAHEQFIRPDWLMPPHRVGYAPRGAANPFTTFEQIPPAARYQFLLDNILPIFRTCFQGAAASPGVGLDVIDDHFWVLFLAPQYDLSVRLPGFLMDSEKLLVPQLDTRVAPGETESEAIRRLRRATALFPHKRSQLYDITYRYEGRGYEAIWRGGRESDAPALTVFRHASGASVHKGTLGDLPKTVWVVDYPLLERLCAVMVTGYSPYGGAAERLAARVRLDGLRQEAETQFLDFLPQEQRRNSLQYWYGGMDLDLLDAAPSSLPARIAFAGDDAKREFVEYLVYHHFPVETGIDFDDNYLEDGEPLPEPLPSYAGLEEALQGLRSVAVPGQSSFTRLDDRQDSLAYIRITGTDKGDAVVSMVLNRWHDDVTTLRQGPRSNPARNKVCFFPGFIGSSPGHFYDVAMSELPQFLAALQSFDSSPEKERQLDRYRVDGGDEGFWEIYDWFQQRFAAGLPAPAGVIDLHSYGRPAS